MIRLLPNVFVRHAGDESVIRCPRTGGCTILRNAKPILDEVKREWRSINDIVQVVSSKFDCAVDEVREGVETVVGELLSQQFAMVKTSDSTERIPPSTAREDTCLPGDDWTPLGDFYARHGLPCELHVDLTDGCNEKCVHCYLPHGRAQYIDKCIAFKVLKEFRDAQGLTVYISGGECMLHKDFAEILRYVKSLDLNIIVMSNLTLCDEKTVVLLKEIDPQFVNVSLYAVNEAIHDSITQVPGSCRKTKAEIDVLQAAGVHIRIATPFMRENKGCVAELKEYAEKRHVHLIADSEIFGQLDHSCTNQVHALSKDELEGLISSYRELFWQGVLEPVNCSLDTKVCDIGETRLNLNSKGLYYPCDGFHGAIIGDARKDTIMDVWTGEALNKLRALKNKDFGSCALCADRVWCKVCPMRNFNETGNMFTHAPWRCEATRIYRKVFEEK